MASEPSQSPDPPVIATQRSERAVATVPKIFSEPVIAWLVDVAEVDVELPVMFKFPMIVEEAVGEEPQMKLVVEAEIPADG